MLISAFSMMVALAQPVMHLTVQPWTGKDLTTTTAAAARYRLVVEGKPNATSDSRGHRSGERMASGVLHDDVRLRPSGSM